MQSEKKEERKKEKIKTHRLALPCVIAKPLWYPIQKCDNFYFLKVYLFFKKFKLIF
jgi:hypothetical protein